MEKEDELIIETKEWEVDEVNHSSVVVRGKLGAGWKRRWCRVLPRSPDATTSAALVPLEHCTLCLASHHRDSLPNKR